MPFGRGERLGVVVEVVQKQPAVERDTKRILDVLDSEALITPTILQLAQWAAEYYQHPLGEVLSATLPGKLKRGQPETPSRTQRWRLNSIGRDKLHTGQVRGPRQRQLLALCQSGPVGAEDFAHLDFRWRPLVTKLVARGWLSCDVDAPSVHQTTINSTAFLPLNPAQLDAVQTIKASRENYTAFLLDGVTGSGKTEVYLHLLRDIVSDGGQALVLVPEIALTEALVERFRARFGGAVAALHSGLTAAVRARVWKQCRDAHTRIVLGTRSAVWLPLPHLKFIVVDEEHDLSYKQQEGFRYSARDVAVMRAHNGAFPIVLGSATPSLESQFNVATGKYRRLELPQRAGAAQTPSIQCLDLRCQQLDCGLSPPLIAAIKERLARSEQILLFLNRRGYAPITLCHRCGWVVRCERCDANLVMHKHRQRLECHHCGARQYIERCRLNHECGEATEFVTLGVGTEQLAEAAARLFPGARIARIDRDTMASKKQLERTFAAIRAQQVDILIGTQMLAKGHDFHAVTLVAIIDADSRLFSLDFRAEERFAQLITQVGGRAGRALLRGTVLLQTHHPEHPLFRSLFELGYRGFSARALHERARAELPPYTALALVRAEATDPHFPAQFLHTAAETLRERCGHIRIEGPLPAPLARRAGKTRAQLLLQTAQRSDLAKTVQTLLTIIPKLAGQSRVRWSIDIDPQESI